MLKILKTIHRPNDFYSIEEKDIAMVKGHFTDNEKVGETWNSLCVHT